MRERLTPFLPGREAFALPVILAGIAGAGFAVAERESDPVFVQGQTHRLRIVAADVAAAVRRSPEPAPERLAPGKRATCRAGEVGDLRNPWRCTVAYPSGRRIAYTVRIDDAGGYRGVDRGGQHVIYGCCVRLSAVT